MSRKTCAKCGARSVAISGDGRFVYYQCSSYDDAEGGQTHSCQGFPNKSIENENQILVRIVGDIEWNDGTSLKTGDEVVLDIELKNGGKYGEYPEFSYGNKNNILMPSDFRIIEENERTKPTAQWFNSLHNAKYNEDNDSWEIDIPTGDSCHKCYFLFQFESVLHTSIVTEFYADGESMGYNEAELPHNLTCSQIMNLIYTLKAA